MCGYASAVLAEPDAVEQRLGARSCRLGAREAEHAARRLRHVAERGQVREEVEALEHHADARAHGAAAPRVARARSCRAAADARRSPPRRRLKGVR